MQFGAHYFESEKVLLPTGAAFEASQARDADESFIFQDKCRTCQSKCVSGGSSAVPVGLAKHALKVDIFIFGGHSFAC